MSLKNQTPPKKKIFDNQNSSQPLMKSLSNTSQAIPKITELSNLKMEASAICPSDMEQFLILFRQPQPINLAISQSQSQQYYEQLENESEKLRIKLKSDARVVHSIIEKHNKIKSNRQKCIDSMNGFLKFIQEQNKVSRYSELNKSIKYNFNQLESLLLELQDIQSEAFTFTRVMTISQINLNASKISNQFETNESEFLSLSMQLFSQIELHAKEFEQNISEKRRIMHINQNYYQYKQVCQGLIELIQKYPQFEENKIQQMGKLEQLAAIYFNNFQQSLQEQITHYQMLIEQIRQSLAVIDKMKYFMQQAKNVDCLSEHYLQLESELTGDKLFINETNSNLRIVKSYQRQFKDINILNYQYFNILRRKVQAKCLIEFDKIQFDIKQTQLIQKKILTYIKQYKQYQNLNYKDLIQKVLVNLKQQLTKQSWLYLISLYKEWAEQKQQLNIISQNLSNILQQNSALDRLKQRFNKLIKKEIDEIISLYPQLSEYLQIKDINAQIEFEKLQIDFNEQIVKIDPAIQEITTNINSYIDIEEIEQQNQKKTNFKSLFHNLCQLEPTIKRLSHKPISGKFGDIKQRFINYLAFQSDILCLLETIQYLHQGNLYQIVEDFADVTILNERSALGQLMELAQGSIKRISEITSKSLLEIKEHQLRQFQWVWVFFQYFESYRLTIHQVFNGQNKTLSLNQYLSFQKDHKFSQLFYQLSKCNKNVCQFWNSIQFQLAKICLKSFLIIMPKFLDKIILLDSQQLLPQIQFDHDNCQEILNFLESKNTQLIAKYICMQQIYRKMKQLSVDQIEAFGKIKDYFSEMEQQMQDIEDSGFQFIQKIVFSDSNRKEEELYADLQEQWILDHLEKGETYFLQDLLNQEGIFDKSLMSMTPRLTQIAKMHMEQSVNWRNIRQILKI